MLYVIQVIAGREKATLELIEELIDGACYDEAFIPQREVMRHRSGRWVRERETLFPGYLFVDTRHPEKLAGKLSSVTAFARLLGRNGWFAPLAQEEERLIRAFMGDDHVVEVSEGVIEGSEVRILSGPLCDHNAIIEKIDRHRRSAVVRMSIMGRDVSVALGLEVVRKTC